MHLMGTTESIQRLCRGAKIPDTSLLTGSSKYKLWSLHF